MSQRERGNRVGSLADEVHRMKRNQLHSGVRKESRTLLFGWPLWSVAIGPDPKTGELRGHAMGIIAVGDFARGVIAIGGIARGVFALGGIAFGVFAFGGLSLGLLVACGGLALGLFALGGLAVGGVAVGGAAIGYYACGGLALGKFVISATAKDPQAVQLFRDWIPWLH